MLARIKALFGGSTVEDPYEREVLKREHARLEAKIQSLRARLGGVQCSTCPKEENPQARRAIDRMRALEEKQEDIEAKLGERPEYSGTKSKRARS